MTDNTGNYLTYAQLILEMYLAGNTKVSQSDMTISSKVVDAGGDIYEYSVVGGDPIPAIGDVIQQAGYSDCIIEILAAPDRIRIVKTDAENLIVNGPVDLLKSTTVPKGKGEKLIKTAMELIDQKTGQFFNKRSGVFKLPGRNTHLMPFPVPIIEISELLINSTKTPLKEGEDFDFFAFKGREQPNDDRRNPKIELNTGCGRGSIYTGSLTSRIFVRGTLTQITGSFGFLEPDGSTPDLIQKAVLILVMEEINKPIAGSASSTSGTGPLKRLKVDIHEQEFFENQSNKDSSRSSGTGNVEVDRVIAIYRTPIRIGGSFKLRRLHENDVTRTSTLVI